MADLEKLKPMDEMQLRSALTGTLQTSRRRLSDEESQDLVLLVGQMVQRYPSQDLEQSLEGYLADFEQLALRYSLAKVQRALAELRVTPGQRFFPRPDEVAEMLEKQREDGVQRAQRSEGNAFLREWEEHKRHLMSPSEVSFRRERFGYDPYTEPEAV